MPVALSVSEAAHHLADPAMDALVRAIGIPPRPQVVSALHAEMHRPEPDPQQIARIVAADVALSAAVLRVSNSPAYGLTRRVETLNQALMLLGLRQVAVMVTGIVMRKVLPTDGPLLTRFWDVSAKRSWALAVLARGLGSVEVDIAQTFGLFCDVGIPLLLRRIPEYGRTLQACNSELLRSFTEVEQERHQTDHALIGALMARSWGVSQTVCLAIRLHHDYALFSDPETPEVIARMVAMLLLADRAIQTFSGMNSGHEWAKGGEAAMRVLGLGEAACGEWTARLNLGFFEGAA
jgi:HD-like signal output (HDOD) protein